MKMKREAKKIMDDSDSRIKGILSSDQWNQYQLLKAEMKQEFKEHRQQ